MSSTQQIYSMLTVNIWKSYMWTVVVQNELEYDLHSNEHYLSSSDKKGWNKFRPVQDLNPWPLQYQCSALPTELTSQLGAGHFVAIYLFSDRSHFDVKVLLQQEQEYVLTQGKIESICSTYTLKTCR